ncbi:sodium:proton antiporter [Tepiditoga spiralis]|uniref:Sodium:proton antiporter n=1 Tax=Tepiditoga spiralis TaxID=2108365 RepID=A0A7G1GCB1_9BACT|nr:Na(+)/H(+) antiporter subunit B [Tepiditoga spiralis]BBE32069.1 sodium:proton antiporter [Tepiditoga spiralis]
MTITIYFLFLILIVISFYILFQKKHINTLLAYGSFGIALSGIFFIMNAPEVAIVEITIGSAFVFFIYLIALKKTATLKVLYVETPYLIEIKKGNLYGFEYYILDTFLKKRGYEAEYIKVDPEKSLSKLKKNGDILIGGIVVEDKIEGIHVSETHLPTKILKIGNSLKTTHGILYNNLEQKMINELKKDFVIDVIRYKHLMYKGKKFDDIEEVKKTGYKIIFNEKNAFLIKDFNEYINEIKENEKLYNELVRRYIG